MEIIDDVDKAAFQEKMLPAVKAKLDEEQLDLLERIIALDK